MARRKYLARWFLKKNLPWGIVLKFCERRRQVLGEVRRGAGTCEVPCILGGVLDSAFMQARVRLSCSDSLIYTGLHTFRRHASPPQVASDGIYRTLVRSPREEFFSKIIRPNSSFGAPEERLSSKVRNAMQHLHLILGRNALWCSRQNK